MGSGTDAAIGAATCTAGARDHVAPGRRGAPGRRTSVTVTLQPGLGLRLQTMVTVLCVLAARPAAQPDGRGGAAMSASSVLVAGNSLRLRRWQPATAARRTPARAGFRAARGTAPRLPTKDADEGTPR
ncbi:hypothetical protein GCM10020221_25030 [Streptomyces thioluteus]|uniref:Uncharacterized protein n=2 Tax=Streptomyces thioluteus TaxID=66431 RepID=A0ABP6JDD7_STRTU